MLLRGSNAVEVSLRPVRWQFGPHDTNLDNEWLIVRGTVDTGDLRWSFSDPCLLIAEARELARWLRAAGQDRIRPAEVTVDGRCEPSLSFLEPVLGFSLARHRVHERVVRLHLCAESAPPGLPDDVRWTQEHLVEVHMSAERILAAGEQWTRELDALPARPWVDAG